MSKLRQSARPGKKLKASEMTATAPPPVKKKVEKGEPPVSNIKIKHHAVAGNEHKNPAKPPKKRR